jgi:hypothetical protein
MLVKGCQGFCCLPVEKSNEVALAEVRDVVKTIVNDDVAEFAVVCVTFAD